MLSHKLRRFRAAAAQATDANFKQVSLLLHGDGTNGAQNNTFLDSSTNNFSLTRTGTPTQGTYTPFSQAAGYWSNYFAGGSDELQVPQSTSLDFGSSNFTVEAWVYITGSVTFSIQNIFNKRDSNGVFTGLTFSSSNYYTWIWIDGTAVVPTNNGTPVPKNQWVHLAYVRSANNFRTYINGVLNQNVTLSITAATQNVVSRVGNDARFSQAFGGYISNLRVVIGSAVYTSAFTPSTTPLTAITNTRLLTCQSNSFVDNSSNNFTITPNNTPQVQPWSPFAPTSAYSTSVNGGSLYFNDTGTPPVSIASNTALNVTGGAFTMEAWVYYPTSGRTPMIAAQDNSVGDGQTFQFRIETNDRLGFVYWTTSFRSSAVLVTSSNALKINQWNHVVVSYTGSTLYLFINGVQGLSNSVASMYSANNVTTIGSLNSAFLLANRFIGYIANFRMIKGTAVYTANFTPPTAPLTAITNTQLLLNGTNAGIFDNAIKNNLVTVGNAQISTGVTKFGTGSISFDGTGDWLTLLDTPNLQLGTDNFTIEGWVYLNAIGSARGFVSKGTSTTGWSLGTNSLNQIVFNHTSSSITSTGVLLISTWYFVTVVREGTGTNQTKIYINGTNDGTGTVSGNFNQTNILYVGADRVGGSALNGYIDDLRITKGVARYTANFTPPSQAFPNQ